MSPPAAPNRISARAVALQIDFDQQFAQAETSGAEPADSILALRFDTAPYAVLLAEIAEIARTPPLLAVPSGNPAFLGLIALRGALIPVYDLAAMLGHSPSTTQDWMLLVRNPHSVAYAFDEFEGHRQIAAAENAGNAVKDDAAWRPLISLSNLTKILQE